ncbi:hypothetical protein BHM03_00029737 [Ensete ventricosum]|nr:hypothetical protein BHM03_00029737 [Ensete ventricosum]
MLVLVAPTPAPDNAVLEIHAVTVSDRPYLYQVDHTYVRECSGIPKTAAWLVAGASPASYRSLSSFSLSSSASCSVRRRRTFSISAVDSTATAEPEAARRLYVGNIPRTVNNEELTKMFAEHGSVAKAEVL